MRDILAARLEFDGGRKTEVGGQRSEVRGQRSEILTSALCAFLMLVASVASAQDKFDAAARAKVIAPWIDEQTLAVVHVDLSRVNVDALVDQIAPLKLFPAE